MAARNEPPLCTEVGQRGDGRAAERLTRVGLSCALAWVLLAAFFVRGTGDDWRIFWNAGHRVGSDALITVSHFAYTPGAAWALWPFAQLPLAAGYFLYVAVMVALAVGAAWLATKVYILSLPVATLMALAWAPFTIAICLGQNTPVALLCVMLAIVGFVRTDQTLAGISVGMLLYKPSDAVPLMFLFLIWKQWRALGIVVLWGLGWYLLSAIATSDWIWPVAYVRMLAVLYRHDVALNADYAISLPTMLVRLGTPTLVAWAVGAATLVASAPLLLRVSRLQAASVVPLIGIACSPHAWGYEAMLALPAMWLAASRLSPLRTALLIAAYAIAPIYLYVRPLHFDALAIPVLAGAAYWFASKVRGLVAQP